jgi:hypothetical protein
MMRRRADVASYVVDGTPIVPLYRSPTLTDAEAIFGAGKSAPAANTPPTLTDAEREAISEACDEGRWYPKDYHHIDTLRGLLERTRNGAVDGRETVR